MKIEVAYVSLAIAIVCLILGLWIATQLPRRIEYTERYPVFNLEGEEIGYTEISKEKDGPGLICALPLAAFSVLTSFSVMEILEKKKDC